MIFMKKKKEEFCTLFKYYEGCWTYFWPKIKYEYLSSKMVLLFLKVFSSMIYTILHALQLLVEAHRLRHLHNMVSGIGR